MSPKCPDCGAHLYIHSDADGEQPRRLAYAKPPSTMKPGNAELQRLLATASNGPAIRMRLAHAAFKAKHRPKGSLDPWWDQVFDAEEIVRGGDPFLEYTWQMMEQLIADLEAYANGTYRPRFKADPPP